jgi:hypothetical protein
MNLEDILGQLPIDDIAGRLGVDPQTARNAVQLALPTLVGGMHANAQDDAASQSLTQALGQHDNGLLDAVLGGRSSLDDVDTSDGGRIVSHVFGDNTDQVVHQLGAAGGVSSSVMSKLLPMLAPLVMSYLAKRMFGGGGSARAGSAHAGSAHGGSSGSGSAGGGGLADILGQVLGGGGGSLRGGDGSGGGIDLGSILGGLLGAGRR